MKWKGPTTPILYFTFEYGVVERRDGRRKEGGRQIDSPVPIVFGHPMPSHPIPAQSPIFNFIAVPGYEVVFTTQIMLECQTASSALALALWLVLDKPTLIYYM